MLVGVGNGALDVSMNSHAVAVEERYGRPIMSSFHAAFSFGALGGSVVGGLVAAAGVGPLPHFAAVVALVLVAFVSPTGRSCRPARTPPRTGRRLSPGPPGRCSAWA